ncbi:hypothetical protein MKEN_01160800 [Mycena kentingensis (nom. inval.)]|nr:hypothetical protein MKEN_01160800 [Mycena kentingensis (nom. inval.)]
MSEPEAANSNSKKRNYRHPGSSAPRKKVRRAANTPTQTSAGPSASSASATQSGTSGTTGRAPAGPSTTTTSGAAAAAGPSNGAAAAAGPSSGAAAAAGPSSGAGAAMEEEEPRRRRPNGIVPDELTPIQQKGYDSFQKYIRGLCGLLDSKTGLPSAEEELAFWDQRYDADKVDNSFNFIRDVVEACKAPAAAATRRADRLEQQIKGKEVQVKSRIATALSTIPQQHFAAAFEAMARLGLRKFLPDVHGSAGPGSAYNQAHRHIAVSTFEAAATRFGMSDLTVSLTFARDFVLLGALYDFFVFRTLAKKSRRVELHGEMVLENDAILDAARKRRARLCERRLQQAQLDKIRKPLKRMLANPACHSDDELMEDADRTPEDPVKYKWHVCHKPLRNPLFTDIVRVLDARIQAKLDRVPNAGRKPDPRKVDTPRPPSKLSGIHPNVDNKIPLPPIDFFTPAYFNALDVDERVFFSGDTSVAFPDSRFCTLLETPKWIQLNSKDFMKKYGEEILARYSIPTAEEIAAWEEEQERKAAGEDPQPMDLDDTDDEDEPQPSNMEH